jgi:hypothetical protein
MKDFIRRKPSRMRGGKNLADACERIPGRSIQGDVLWLTTTASAACSIISARAADYGPSEPAAVSMNENAMHQPTMPPLRFSASR